MSEEQNSDLNNQIIRGCLFPKSVAFTRKNIEGAMDYVPRDGDLIIGSYPKAGSTWMQYILLQIVSRGETFPTFHDVTRSVAPMLEISGIEALKTQKSKPRICKHHIRYDLVQKNDKSKYIYIYRNPEDIVVSFFGFINNLHPELQLNFDHFFETFVTGTVAYGCYFKHFLSFYEHRNDANLLMVSYEKLHKNRREEILRIAKFLAGEYYQSLSEDEEILSKVIKHTSFEYMKANLKFMRADGKNEVPESESEDKQTVNFFRKGIVGDGKNVLTQEQRERINQAALKVLSETSVIKEWYPE